MENEFYNDFDTECLEKQRKSDYRTPFQKDRDRIIHSSAFRRLQSKTQVFIVGEYDFYRTRLTHSLEVAQIGRSICNFLSNSSSELSNKFFIDPDLVEGVCLSHDIGHPPFGHAGEKVLNRLMNKYGGFEGNAQTLRLVSKTIFSARGKREGINPSRAFLDGILKYKSVFNLQNNSKNHFVYVDQEDILRFVFNSRYSNLIEMDNEAKNSFRSIECQIMDWADDTAYSLNDLVDGIHAGFLSIDKLEQWSADSNINEIESTWISQVIGAIRAKTVNPFIAKKIGLFIQACNLTARQNILSDFTNRYKYSLKITPEILDEAKFYKKIARQLVFLHPRVHLIQSKAEFMLCNLYHVLQNNYLKEEGYLHLIPSDEERLIFQIPADDPMRARLVCDYIAGMTDQFAVNTYRRLFDPTFGSIGDLI